MAEELTLRLPRMEEEQEFLHAHRATTPEQRSFLHHYEEGMPLARYLQVLGERACGINLAPEDVPSTFLFAFVNAKIVGRVSIRHCLNAELERVNGHVAYVVVPEFRRRGYAGAILRQALQIAREKLGLRRVLLTCDDDNVGSAVLDSVPESQRAQHRARQGQRGRAARSRVPALEGELQQESQPSWSISPPRD